jgi:hypothetical protein
MATTIGLGAVGALTFSAIISQLSDKLGNLINDAENAGEVLLTSAGAQIASAIEYAKVSYADSLNLTFDRLSAAQKSFIDDITTEIGYVQNKVIAQLQQIVQRGSMAINALPLSNTFPQLGWYSPSYISPSEANVTIQFNGNFFDSARSGFSPTLAIAGHTLTPATNSTLQLTFAVPTNIVTPKPNDLTPIQMVLSVPYRKAELFGALHSRQVASFNAKATLLPPHAGTIEFDTDQMQSQRFTQPNQSGQFIQESTDDDIPDPIASGRVSSASVTPGWFVNPALVTIQYTHTEGDWNDFGNRSNVTTAAWSIATHHHRIGSSGKVHFILHWTEYQDRQVHVPGQQQQPLEWSSSRAFTVPSGGSWSAKYTDFRGKTYDIGSAAFTNPYVTVSTSGNSVMITTIP